MLSIESHVNACLRQIAQCAGQANREAKDVQLVAVSKTRTVAEIQQVLAAGCHHIGESYVQEALPKLEQLKGEPLIWHFIGPIQSNKTQLIAQHFDWVHSLCREKIAKRLNDQRPDNLPKLNVCIQVNISNEPTKSGLQVTEIEALAQLIMTLPRLQLRGLMAIPQPGQNQDEKAQRQPFKRLYSEFLQLKQQGFALDTLSMGMSADMCAAIKEGATIVRVGSAIFGPRR